MRQLLLRFAVAPGLFALSCATAMEEGGFGAPLDTEDGGTSNGNSGGSLITSGTGGGNGSSGSTSISNGGKAGSSTGAFGGTVNTGGSGGSDGGKAGSATGGKGGSGGAATAGSSTGGKGGSGTSGSSNGGSSAGSGGGGSAGSPGSTVCDGVPDWTPATYKIGDTVASTCSGVFTGTCTPGQSHKFECNPAAGVPALPWCTSREPGVGNGWAEAWVDKGQCQ